MLFFYIFALKISFYAISLSIDDMAKTLYDSKKYKGV